MTKFLTKDEREIILATGCPKKGLKWVQDHREKLGIVAPAISAIHQLFKGKTQFKKLGRPSYRDKKMVVTLKQEGSESSMQMKLKCGAPLEKAFKTFIKTKGPFDFSPSWWAHGKELSSADTILDKFPKAVKQKERQAVLQISMRPDEYKTAVSKFMKGTGVKVINVVGKYLNQEGKVHCVQKRDDGEIRVYVFFLSNY